MKKGANAFDVSCHRAFDMFMEVMTAHKTESACRKCGNELEYVYCEERLYLVGCKNCRVAALVEGKSPKDAARHTLGY